MKITAKTRNLCFFISYEPVKWINWEKTRMKHYCLLLGPAIALFSWGDASLAETSKVYWAGEGIHRANLDGSKVENLIVPTQPSFVAIDSATNKLYWADWYWGQVRRSNLDGSEQELIFALQEHKRGPWPQRGDG